MDPLQQVEVEPRARRGLTEWGGAGGSGGHMGARDVYDALAALQACAASGWVMQPGGCIEWKGPGAPPRGLPLARAAVGQGGASGATYGLVVEDDAGAGAASGDKEPVASDPFFVAVGTDVASPGDSEANLSLDESASVGFF